MAVYSMTGFANAAVLASVNHDTQAAAASGLSIELRSVNSRFLDLNFRLPDDYRGLEGALRERLTQSFRRGKIEVRLNVGKEADHPWPEPRPEQLMNLSRIESMTQGWMPKATPLSVNEILQWCRNGTQGPCSQENLLEAAQQAIQELQSARAREGERLVDILRSRIDKLRELATQANPLVPQVVARQQQRFLERWNDALENAQASHAVLPEALRERALNEAASYALRIDVAEELSRLNAHLDEIERLLENGGELGKRLDFLVQELHREANTLGAKSSALELTQISVEMKVAIEQMREQVQNLE
jgi:uncharacterized protein (TIGR00255 family)